MKPGANLPPFNVATPSKKDIDTYARALSEAEQQARQAQAQAERSKEMLRKRMRKARCFRCSANAGMQGGIPGQALIGPDGKTLLPGNIQQQNQPASSRSGFGKERTSQEKEKMEFTSLFASPVALSLRPSVGFGYSAVTAAATVRQPLRNHSTHLAMPFSSRL